MTMRVRERNTEKNCNSLWKYTLYCFLSVTKSKSFLFFDIIFFSSLCRCTRIGVSSTTRSFSLLSVSSFYRVSFCEIHTERLCKAMIIEEFWNVECFWRFRRIFWKLLFRFTLVIPCFTPVYPCLPLISITQFSSPIKYFSKTFWSLFTQKTCYKTKMNEKRKKTTKIHSIAAVMEYSFTLR